MATQPATKITEEEYLRLERAAQQKSELVDGEMFAMAGGSLQHALVAARFIAMLTTKLEGRNCRVFSSDLKIRTSDERIASISGRFSRLRRTATS